LLAVAGAAGTLARFGLSAGVAALVPARSPLPTLVVNVLGCLAFGLLWSLAEHHARLPDPARWLLLTGFLGAFTTFSTFAFDAGRLFSQGHPAAAVGYILASNVLGLSAFFAGWWAAGRVGG
jgi:CrcB protein